MAARTAPPPLTAVPDHQGDTPEEADLAGLTVDDHAVIVEALSLILKVTQDAARRTLEAERPAIQAEVALTEQRAAEARTAALPWRQKVAHLRAELAGCQQRGAELQAASDDEALAVRLEARAFRVAVAEETEALRARLQEAQRAADPFDGVARQAERDLSRAQANLASLDEAIKTPFITSRGQQAEAWKTYLLRTGLWADQDTPESRAIVDRFLRSTKYGEQIERRAIAAFQAGQVPSAGETKHFPDGSALINAGDVPIVVNGRAAPGDLTNLPPVPTSAPSGAEVMEGMRTGAGQMPSQTVTKAAEPLEQEWTLPSAIRRVWRLGHWPARPGRGHHGTPGHAGSASCIPTHSGNSGITSAGAPSAADRTSAGPANSKT